MARGLPTLVNTWFVVTSIVVAIDAAFVLLRPATLPGGALSETQPFSTWGIYAQNDKRYAALDDGWVVLQSYLNIGEVALQLAAVALSVAGATQAAVKVAAAVSLATLYKTVIYFGMEIAEGGKYTSHLTPVGLFVNVILPSSFWIIIPALILRHCLNRLALSAPSVRDAAKRK